MIPIDQTLGVKLDYVLKRGGSYAFPLAIKTTGNVAASVVDYTFKAQLRRDEGGPLVAEFGVDVVSPLEGLVTLRLTAEQTTGVALGKHVWDLKATGVDGDVAWLVNGSMRFEGEVTE